MNTPQSDAQITAMCLPSEMTIQTVAEQLQRMTALLENGEKIVLDAGAVSRVDTASLQLIYVVQKTLTDSGRSIRWQAVSSAFRDSAALTGLTEALALPDVEQAAQ